MVEFVFLLFILFSIRTKSSVPLNIEHGQHSWASTQLSSPHSFCHKLCIATYKLHVEPWHAFNYYIIFELFLTKYEQIRFPYMNNFDMISSHSFLFVWLHYWTLLTNDIVNIPYRILNASLQYVLSKKNMSQNHTIKISSQSLVCFFAICSCKSVSIFDFVT